ncbi:MAG: GxxExxY protein [Planctomycetes bacterium]|nr:GxxExxY protein [Planctomycetota bacterium]
MTTYPDSFDDEIEALAKAAIGAAIEVHKLLGPGHIESVYENALCYELELRGVPFTRQQVFDVDYKGRVVGTGRTDLILGGRLVVELKAVEQIAPVHLARTLWYMRNKKEPLGLMLNFQVARMDDKNAIRRVALSEFKK